MAQVLPFQAYRYAAQAGPLDRLVTQPYDKITPAMQARYLGLDPHNLVRIILGQRFPSDSERDNVYTRAAACLEDWIAGGVLVREPTPCLFAYFQEFTVPDSGEPALRKGFIGLGPVVDYAGGIVHRHEQTLAGPKKDRLELLRHTRAHFGQIFMLHADPQQAIDRHLDEAARTPPDADVIDEYGTVHRLWRIVEPERISAIQAALSDKKLLIADGHHRYETALAFRDEHPELAGARWVMMTFVNLHSPGLKILATHRVIHDLSGFDAAEFLRRARARFRVPPPGSDLIRIGLVTPDASHLLEIPREGRLDVQVLHEEVLGGLLGISEEAVREERSIRYVRGRDAAVDQVRTGAAQAAFILEPTSIEDVARVAFSGGVMPQKSTDFYPKLLSGLTIYRVEG